MLDQLAKHGGIDLNINIEGDLDMACVWPMFWQVNPPDGINKNIGKTSGNGDKRSIFNHVAPYDLNPSYHMFQLFADLKFATWHADAPIGSLSPMYHYSLMKKAKEKGLVKGEGS